MLEKPEWHAALGQIAHLGTQKSASREIKSKGEEAIRTLLECIFIDNSKVPQRVTLSMFARLRNYRNVYMEITRNEEQVAKLSEIIAISGLEGFGQFYEAYVSFTSMFGFDHSSIAINLAEAIPTIFLQIPDSVENGQWLSACEGLVNTANAAKYSNRPELSTKLNEAAFQFAERVAENQELNKFEGRALAKAYLAFGDPRKSLFVISKVKVDEFTHWIQYQKSKAELALGNEKQALYDAKCALEQASLDPDAKKHLAAYYDQHSKCLEANSELKLAIEEIEKAISITKNQKYRKPLEERKTEMETRHYSK